MPYVVNDLDNKNRPNQKLAAGVHCFNTFCTAVKRVFIFFRVNAVFQQWLSNCGNKLPLFKGCVFKSLFKSEVNLRIDLKPSFRI